MLYMNKKIFFSIILTFIFFYYNIFSQSENHDIMTGLWLLKVSGNPSGLSDDIRLNIKYSSAYMRYFGAVNEGYFPGTSTLDSIYFNESERTLMFSCHLYNKTFFNLVLDNDSLNGTISCNQGVFQVSGAKLSTFNSMPVPEYGPYQLTQLPQNLNELFEEGGNKKSDIALIIVQGGPYDKILHDEWFDRRFSHFHLIYAKQAQMINPSIFPPENNLSIEDARNENLITVEILHRIIQYFSGKKVIVWGVSYGAFVIQKYICKYGIEADAIGISAGRLEMEDVMWKETQLNQTVYDISYNADVRTYSKLGYTFSKPVSYLFSTIVNEDYTQTLKNADLSKLVYYQSGKLDGTVGRLNEHELTFLKKNNIKIEICQGCYHRQMLMPYQVNKAIINLKKHVSKSKFFKRKVLQE